MTLTKLFKGFVRYLLKRLSLITYIACFINLKRVILFKGSLQSWFLKNSFHFIFFLYNSSKFGGRKMRKNGRKTLSNRYGGNRNCNFQLIFCHFLWYKCSYGSYISEMRQTKSLDRWYKAHFKKRIIFKKIAVLKIVKTTIEKFNFETKPSSELVM